MDKKRRKETSSLRVVAEGFLQIIFQVYRLILFWGWADWPSNINGFQFDMYIYLWLWLDLIIFNIPYLLYFNG